MKIPQILLTLSILLASAHTIYAADSLKVNKIVINTKNVFDDAAVHTSIEKRVYDIGNWFHIKTKESVIRDRLPFEEGSSVTEEEMKEAEKNLRALPYISDARIMLIGDILYVETSDNWTFSPQLSLGKAGEKWTGAIGLVENNLLGFGHTVGFFFQRGEDRDSKYLLYNSKDFIFPHHSFDFLWSENSDGFERHIELSYPFISRSKNQWSYNAAALWSKRDEPDYFDNLKEDSVSFWLARSFGGASFKTYLGAGYDFHKTGIWQDDSRLGFYVAASRIKLEKRYNLHKVKWAEDVEHGYYIKTEIAKNIEQFGADNDDWYFEQKINLSAGTKKHNFLTRGFNSFYYNPDSIRDMHSTIFGEYIFKPSFRWASVLSAEIDSWQRTDFKRVLYLDGNSIFPGMPSRWLAGENTFAFKAEQRFFPGFEIFTAIPIFTAFLTAGEATDNLRDFDPINLEYMAGIGLRVSSSKSVQGVVSHVNLSMPLSGDARGLKFSFIGKYEL